MLLAAAQAALAELPQNSHAWTYTIRGFDNSEYLTRTLLPRVAGHRVVLHRIYRPDADRHLHNHPWRTARFLIVSGGYVEERLVGSTQDGRIERRILGPGEVNELDAGTFHRIDTVWPNTWTFGLLGDRVQDWGFLVGGELKPHAAYFASKNYRATAPGLS
jgi:hypothetical protein